MRNRSLKDRIFELAERCPQETALLSCSKEGETEKSYTFLDLKNEIVKTGNWLQKDLGLAKGDVLGLAFPNSVELLMLSWSAWALGVVTVPLDMKRDTFKDYQYKLELSKAKVLVTREGMFSSSEQETFGKMLQVAEVGAVQNQKEAADDISWERDVVHAALILFTSGTTAKPKGVELNLENLLVNAEGIQEWFGIKKEDRFLVLLPLYHINSTTFSLASLISGASVAAVPVYSNSRFWQQLAKTQSTFTSIVPTICYDQLSRKEEFEAVKPQLKVTKIQIGSAPVIPHDSQKFVEQFGIPLYQGYGQTETALRVTGVPLDIGKEFYGKLLQENSIGKPMNWAEVEVMDAEGNVLHEGQEGELAVKGKAVMKGYIKNEEATRGAFKNGYFLTGDIGCYKVIEGERYFFLKGRSKEIIIKGGVNLSPVAIESRLKEINKDIDQVYVVGLKDERYGEEVGAVICWEKSGKTLPELETRLKFQLTSPVGSMVPFEIPKYVKSIKAEELPTTSTGKVQRSVIKATIPQNEFEKTVLFAKNETHEFLRLTREDRPLLQEALQLYNHCWQPLLLDEKIFLEQAQNGAVLLALNEQRKMEGMITFLRTNVREEQLKNISYRELTDNFTLKNNEKEGDTIVCISICSASYEPPASISSNAITIIPSKEQMAEYLVSGKDLTYNFHKKPKGGILGADLVSLVADGRPEDKMSLGYNMLLKYPSLAGKDIGVPDSKASLAVQLLECVMRLATLLGVSELYAFSRPAGASQYFAKK